MSIPGGSTRLSRDEMRLLDRMAIEEFGLPGVVLMENAGRAVAEEALRGAQPNDPIVILCGSGNNGGDGYVAARYLVNAGRNVSLFATKAPSALRGDAAVHAGVADKMGIRIQVVNESDLAAAENHWHSAGVLIDALLGTGFLGAVRPPISEMIEAVNACRGSRVVAVDVPSGLDCDTGEPGAPTIRADVTVTFVAAKVGFDHPDAAAWLGKVVVADIGMPKALTDRVAAHRNVER